MIHFPPDKIIGKRVLACISVIFLKSGIHPQMEEAYENIYARADLGKYAAAEDVVKLRKMLELTIKGFHTKKRLHRSRLFTPCPHNESLWRRRGERRKAFFRKVPPPQYF